MLEPRDLPIARDPGTLGGRAVFAGTRVPVDTLIDYIEDGETLETFLRNFPSVTRAQAVLVLEHLRSSVA